MQQLSNGQCYSNIYMMRGVTIQCKQKWLFLKIS